MRFISAALAFAISLSCSFVPYANAQTNESLSVPQPASPTGRTQVRQEAQRDGGRPQLALVLAGGGGRGTAHIGVLKVLEQHGIRPDFVTGNSIGAVIGALYCAGVPVSRLEEMALNGELKKGLLPSGLRWQFIKAFPRYAIMSLLQLKPTPGLYSGKTVARLIEENVPPGVRNIEDLKIPFSAIAVNMRTTRPVWLSKGNLAQAVRASAAVPFIFRPVRNANGDMLIDGALRENLPTDVAKAAGSRLVVAVRLHSVLDEKANGELTNIIGFSDRLISMLLAEIENKALSEADVVVEPEIKNTNTYTFAREDLAKAIEAGEKATQKVLPEIMRRLSGSSAAAASQEAVPQ